MFFRQSHVKSLLLLMVFALVETTCSFTTTTTTPASNRRASLSFGVATSVNNSNNRGEQTTQSSSRVRSSVAVGVTANEFLARARQKAGVVPEEEAPPKIFDDDLLDDMQQTLLTLERRIQEGPGSLSPSEVDELNQRLRIIVQEMRVNRDKKPERPPPPVVATGEPLPTAPAAVAPPAAAAQAVMAPATEAAALHSAPETSATRNEPRQVMDTSNDEAPPYEGYGGMGQPKGTVNTYALPGMDEMSPEEYQRALQQSIIDRAERRRKSDVSSGNRASWDYLNNLSGEKGILKQ